MRYALRLALTALCLATPAAAQQFPITMPGGTVYGRTNIGTGPGQAIPFKNLVANLGASTFVSDVYFESGRPWCDPRAFGALGNQTADDTGAFNSCLTQLAAASGGILYVSSGNYCIRGGLSVTASAAVTIVGEGLNTELQTCGADVTLLTLNNGRHEIRDIVLSGSQATNTTKDTISLGSACTECRINHVLAAGGRYVLNNGAGDVAVNNVNFSQSYGAAVIYNGAASGSPQFWCNRCKIDQNYPVSTPAGGTGFNAWQSAHTYSSVGTVVSTGGFYIQLKTAGTSAGSAPTLQSYGTNITDGTAVWLLVGATTYAAIQLDTGSAAVALHQTDMTGSFTYGLYLSNTLSGTIPQSNVVSDSTFGAYYTAGIQMAVGDGLTVKGSQLTNCINTGCQAVNLNGSGDATLSNNLIFGNPYGIVVNTGNNNAIVGNSILGASISAVYLATNAGNIEIAGNNFGTSTTWGSNTTALTIVAGTGDNIKFIGNNCNGAGTCVSGANGASGTHNVIEQTDGTMSMATLSLGYTGVVGGQAKLLGATSGTVTHAAATAAGTATFTWSSAGLAMPASTGIGFSGASANADALNHPTGLAFMTNGSTKWQYGNGIQIGSPTGGDAGNGTLNAATDLRVNNVSAVLTSRTISVPAPLTGGGDLSANRTISWTGLTSGGVLYASGATSVATSTAPSATLIMLWGGAGNPPTADTGCSIATSSIVCSNSSSGFPNFSITNTTSDATSPAFVFLKSRSGGNTLTSDLLFDLQAQPFANAGYRTNGRMEFLQTASSSGSNVPTKWRLSTSNAAGQINQTMVFDSNAHLSFGQATAPSLTAGCNGAGSSVSGTDFAGTVTGQTSAATTCTLTFGTAFAAAPNCVASGLSSPLTGAVTIATGTLAVNFASTANFKFTYSCVGA